MEETLSPYDKAVLATLAYYDANNMPLNEEEIEQLCVPASRFGGNEEAGPLRDSLLRLSRGNLIEEKEGLYFLTGCYSLCNIREERRKIAEKKWKKAIRAFRWFQAVPYVRGVFASGSLAMNNTKEDSDFDVLVITKSGRIWTCRLLLSVAMSVLGIRRTKYEKTSPDKICLNHYITENSLAIPFHSIYNAHTYAHLVPVWFDDPELVRKFERENRWVALYVRDWDLGERERLVSNSAIFHVLAKTGELVLDTVLGSVFERFSRVVQKKRILKDKAYNAPGGRITIDDTQLEFHPDSPEKKILAKFNFLLQKTPQMKGYQERDSGLIQ